MSHRQSSWVPVANNFHTNIEDSALHELAGYLVHHVSEPLHLHYVPDSKSFVVYITAAQLIPFMKKINQDPKLRFWFMDILGIDYPDREKRFEVHYHLLSYKYNVRLWVKVALADGEMVPTLSEIFPGALWYEREVYDMYGIGFENHPDLRRILTDYGFQGHPLRKDFPLTGHVEVRYDLEQQRVVYQPVQLMQDLRQYDFLNPWEGTDYVLPGDEKAKGEGK